MQAEEQERVKEQEPMPDLHWQECLQVADEPRALRVCFACTQKYCFKPESSQSNSPNPKEMVADILLQEASIPRTTKLCT